MPLSRKPRLPKNRSLPGMQGLLFMGDNKLPVLTFVNKLGCPIYIGRVLDQTWAGGK